MKTKEETTVTSDTNITTFDDLANSDFCMMYFARGCRNKRYARGLCNKHYHAVRSLALTGIITWIKVEMQLKALPPKVRESRDDIAKELGVKD